MTLKTIVTASAAVIAATFGPLSAATACCKAKFERSKPHVNVGTIGHHGRKDWSGQAMVGRRIGRDLAPNEPGALQQGELLILITPRNTTPTK